MPQRPIVAVDFDGTIHDNRGLEFPNLGPPFVGAEEFLRAIHTKYDIDIWSGRCAGMDAGAPVRYWLRKYKLMGVIGDVSCRVKTKNVIMYIDDRARQCRGNEDYKEIMEELGV